MAFTAQVPQPAKTYDAIVVGAGISGMYMLYRLREQGLRVKVLEAGTSVGGTWYWNRYPGARVDSQAYVYQYWFSDELLDEWSWPERFPDQTVMEKYLNHVADRFDLRENIQFNTRVKAARYDEKSGRWTITTMMGEVFDTQYAAFCTGGISAPLVPSFPGHEKFRGQIIHTARWPKEEVDFSGLRVGIVGTGATGIQVIQTVGPQCAHLTVFQRTPNYAVPMRNPKYGPGDMQAFRERYGDLKKRVHRTFAGFDYDFQDKTFRQTDPEEREAILERLWADGSLAMWIGGFSDLFTDAEVNEEISKFVRGKIRERIRDPKVADKLVPTTYGFGTRRVPLETQYYETFNRDNVELVDISDEKIEAITANGVRTSKQEYPLDLLIFATGFDAGTGALSAIDVRGRDNISLKESWKQGIRTTMGLSVHGYPNLFTTMAPFAPAAAFCNVPTCLQQQVDWISDCIQHSRSKGAMRVEPTRDMEDRWIAHHDEVANMTLITKTRSWYMGSNVEGKPPRLLSYMGGVGAYRQQCEDVKASGYEGFSMS
ncbi:acetone monooxygenase [Panacagrimonas perspica]|uniref:Acetone monooxygenase n=1 Tax=Panacagrimonas perspica TaxID=381431 RepID=A0A4S3K491_9GAMM|nr:NAD(P)/FAD-dependent oxidoreductase [Panacagrimonas perspica]TDU25722.1 acetone monooxygenase [Panacagrimonas perspica]THD02890.1 cyclohexanone monooxygenase [Panacagrimonas perspica]